MYDHAGIGTSTAKGKPKTRSTTFWGIYLWLEMKCGHQRTTRGEFSTQSVEKDHEDTVVWCDECSEPVMLERVTVR
jgi:hypothetical protein